MKKILITFTLMVVCSTGIAEVYKCTVDGKTTYSEIPCGGQAKTITIQQAPPDSQQDAAVSSQKSNEAYVNHRTTIRAAINNGEPLVSMTRAELDMAMGRPDKVNSSDYGRGPEDQMIYYRQSKTVYVYTKNAVVTSIESIDGPSRRTKKACPTFYEIRNMEVSASSISVRDTEEGRNLRAKIEEAKVCK